MTATDAYVVIGSAFGDEGKGLITDYLVRDADISTVVRFNGGAQAGHTVVEASRRHVFRMVGAGAFAGADTWLAPEVIVNPSILQEELDVLASKGCAHLIYAHPECTVTTPFDIALNRAWEISRGDHEHGSTGLGINETVTRAEAGFSLEVKDKHDLALVTQFYERTFNEWWLPRVREVLENAAANGIPADDDDLAMYLRIFQQSHTWQEHAARTIFGLRSLAIEPRPVRDDSILFEGAQGLGLDQYLGIFPHVTPSCTGLPGAIRAAEAIGGEFNLEPVYVTRTYVQRHGAGPLWHGDVAAGDVPLPIDQTNHFNEWQGSPRQAPLDTEELRFLINADVDRGSILETEAITVRRPNLAVTHADVIDTCNGIFVIHGDDEDDDPVLVTSVTKFLDQIDDVVGHITRPWLVSYGPTAEDVEDV